MNSKKDIRIYEEFAMNAWPALQTMQMDGWILRFADGFTKRANSINPLYPSGSGLEEKIAECERIYRARQLNPVFKMTPAASPGTLDGHLAQSGYRLADETSLQRVGLSLLKGKVDSRVKIHSGFTREWLEATGRMNKLETAQCQTLQRIVSGIVPQTFFASITVEGRIIACGLGVLERKRLGLFDIVVDPEYRGQGYGGALVGSLLATGAERGAEQAYLQVTVVNQPARRLYAKMGFREVYRYWYRI